MSLIYSRRKRIANDTYVNVSNSNVSVSKKTSCGSFGTGGFSIKTGIPGLSFRQRFGRGKNALPMILFFVGAYLTIGLSYLIISNTLRFLFWVIGSAINKGMSLIR